MIPASANPLLLRSAATQYQVSRSLRYNAPDSSFLSRTPASAGNRKTWTFSCWTKRSILNQNQIIFSAGPRSSSGNATGLVSLLWEGDILVLLLWTSNASNVQLKTTQVFRDPSAWYNIVAVLDTDNATSTDRSRLYVNGSRITTFSSASYPSLGAQFSVNNTEIHEIGRYVWSQDQYLSSYLAEIHFIDGQALTPSSFTEVSATTGQLVPKAYTGSYGTNGFKLNFSNNAAATAAALGADSSGNGNHFTPNNLSVAAGAGNDSLVDSPTSYGTDDGLGGSVRGNYCTWNPLAPRIGGTLANGNLDASTTSNGSHFYGSINVSTGKWYWEITASALTFYPGIANSISDVTTYWVYHPNGNFYIGGTIVGSGAAWTTGDIIGCALNMDAGTLVFYKNGVSQGTAFSSLNSTYFPFVRADVNGSFVANFGQRPFAYTAPSGFKALCDTNLPAPVVAKPNTVMDVVTYTGTGASRSITGLGFSPDLVWMKCRSFTHAHQLYDTIRGTNKALYSNLTNSEFTDTDALTAFNSDGFTLGAEAGINESSRTYVAWTWDAGSSTVTNTQGSINSQVRANASSGFSVVSWSGVAGANGTIGHGLGVAPQFVILKNRGTTDNWRVYHVSVGATGFLQLASTGATVTSDEFQNTSPTSTVFYLRGNTWNAASNNYIAYFFAPVSGYSSFGSYVGNGSASDNAFVFTGFRPRYVLIKGTASGPHWVIHDSSRTSANPADKWLLANTSGAEGTAASNSGIDLLSNGFKVRDNSESYGTNGGTYIYAAFAESSFAYSRAR